MYSVPQTYLSNSPTDPTPQSGTSGAQLPLKKPPVSRGSHACTRCRRRKQRCNGELPCSNCQHALVDKDCVFVAHPERRKRRASEALGGQKNPLDIPTTFTPTAHRSTSFSIAELPGVNQSFDAYLQRHPQPIVHQGSPSSASFVREAAAGNATPTLFPHQAHGSPDGAMSSNRSVDSSEDAWSDEAARGVAFLSLNASGNPIYVGPSSGFSWARVILGGMAADAEGATKSARHFSSEVINQPVLPSHSSAPHATLSNSALEDISHELADLVLSKCFRHIQPRFAFLDWIMVHEYWEHRNEIMLRASQPNPTKDVSTAAFFIWMLFAIGARLCQKSSVAGLATPESYYAKAMEHLEVIVGLHDLKNVQALMLIVVYSFQSPTAPSVWFLVGIIVRVSVSLGLHRQLRESKARDVSPYTRELRKRIFWTCYTLDRMMANSLGRPVSISDRDIDVELPFDVDCVEANPTLGPSFNGCTSMTSAIHVVRIQRIQSLILKQSYRVDRPTNDIPDALLAQIDAWEAAIPSEASTPACESIPCCERDWFLIKGAEARMYLLRPLTVNRTAQPMHVVLLAQCAASACDTHKRLHQSFGTAHSIDSLRSTFLCGLTLLHAVRLDHHALPQSTLQRAICSCSNTLFAYSQLFPAAQAFHNAFEDLASNVLEAVASSTSSKEVAPMMPQESTGIWQTLLNDNAHMFDVYTPDNYASLLQSLGIPIDSFAGQLSESMGADEGYDPMAFGSGLLF